MLKYCAILMFVLGSGVGCGGGGDKCEKAFSKVAPLLKNLKHKDDGKADGKDEKDKEVSKCREDLKKHPERVKMLDCIIDSSGEMTEDKMMACAKSEMGEKSGGDMSASGDSAMAMAKMTEFKDKMCACKDTACATAVSDEMTKWSTEMAKTQKEPPHMTPDDTKKMTEVGEAMGKCMQTAMTPPAK